MGTYIDSMTWDDVWMPAANEQVMLDALAKKVKKSKHNPWPHNFDRYDTIEKLTQGGPLHGISVERQGDRIVFGDDNNREKVGDLDELFSRMAPHMGGGTIYMTAESEHWKWVFKNGKLLIHEGRVVYTDDLPDGYVLTDDMWTRWFLPGGEPPDELWFEVAR